MFLPIKIACTGWGARQPTRSVAMKSLSIFSTLVFCSLVQAGTIREIVSCRSAQAPIDAGYGVSIFESFGSQVNEVNTATYSAKLSMNSIAGMRDLQDYSIKQYKPTGVGGSLTYKGRGFLLILATDSAPVDGMIRASLEAKFGSNPIKQLKEEMLCNFEDNDVVAEAIDVKGDLALELFRLLSTAKAQSLPVMDAIIYNVSDVKCSSFDISLRWGCEMTDHDGTKLHLGRGDALRFLKLMNGLGVETIETNRAYSLKVESIHCTAGTFIGAPTGMTTSCQIQL